MKLAKQIRRKPAPPEKFFVIDETYRLFCSPDYTAAALQKWNYNVSPNAALLATQAVIRSHSGKRLRFIGSMKRTDGSPLKPAPKKFIP